MNKTLLNKLDLPSFGQVDTIRGTKVRYTWTKKAGISGEPTLQRVYDRAVKLGWKIDLDRLDSSGGQLGSTVVLTDARGNRLVLTRRYGLTPNDTVVSITCE